MTEGARLCFVTTVSTCARYSLQMSLTYWNLYSRPLCVKFCCTGCFHSAELTQDYIDLNEGDLGDLLKVHLS